MNTRLKSAVLSEPVPAHLEMRVRASIRAAQKEKRHVPFAPVWGLAATMAVLAIGFFWLRRGENAYIASVTQTVSAFMRVGLVDHLHCTILRRQSAQPVALETMQTKLGPKYAALLPAVQAHVPRNYQVLDAHQCKAQGRDFIHLVLNQGDRYLSVVVTAKNSGEDFSTAKLIPSLAQAGISFYQQGTGNYQVAGFESNQHLVYVISDLGQKQNEQLMAAMAGDLQKALTTL